MKSLSVLCQKSAGGACHLAIHDIVGFTYRIHLDPYAARPSRRPNVRFLEKNFPAIRPLRGPTLPPPAGRKGLCVYRIPSQWPLEIQPWQKDLVVDHQSVDVLVEHKHFDSRVHCLKVERKVDHDFTQSVAGGRARGRGKARGKGRGMQSRRANHCQIRPSHCHTRPSQCHIGPLSFQTEPLSYQTKPLTYQTEPY